MQSIVKLVNFGECGEKAYLLSGKNNNFSLVFSLSLCITGMDGVQMWCSVVTQSLAQYIKRIVTFCKQIPGN